MIVKLHRLFVYSTNPDTPWHAARELSAEFRRHLLVPNPGNLGKKDVTPLCVDSTELPFHNTENILNGVEVGKIAGPRFDSSF